MQWSHPAAISQSINVTFLWKTYPLTPSVSFLLFFISYSSNLFIIDHFAQYTWPGALILKPIGLAWSLTMRVTLAQGWKKQEAQSSSSSRDLSRNPTNVDSLLAEPKLYRRTALFKMTRTLIVMLRFVRKKSVQTITENQIPIVTDEFKI